MCLTVAGSAKGSSHHKPRQLYDGLVAAASTPPNAAPASVNRQILSLAIPAFAALVAQPLFVVADTAVIARLGTAQLAGLAVGSTITTTLVGVFVFLAYGSTATVARLLGAGRRRDAVASGVQSMWLAVALGVLVAALGWALAPQLAGWLGAEGQVLGHAISYLRWSLPGLPGMLLTLAATGTLRGLADGRTPMVLAIAAAVLNLAGDLWFVFGLGMGVGGSGLATAIAETWMGLAATVAVVRGARRLGAGLSPSPPGMRTSLAVGTPLLVRTLALRAALLATTAVAARLGTLTLAAHQVVFTIWGFLGFALDAVAIAGQTLIGIALGRADLAATRALTRRMLAWSLGAGVVLGALTIAVRGPLARLLTPDRGVQQAVTAALLVIGATLVITAWVTLFDGVLIGAGDGVYLARVGVLVLAGYLPLAWAVARFAPEGVAGVVWLWVGFAIGFMGLRALSLWARQRTDAWMVTGA